MSNTANAIAGYKQTEIGSIPEDWAGSDLISLSIKITDGSHFSPKEDITGKYCIATVKNFSEYGINFDTCKKISARDYDNLVKGDCKPLIDDILISKDGTMGIVYVVKESLEIVLLSSIAIVRPNKDKINAAFLSYYLRNNVVQNLLIDNFSSGSALPRIVLKDLKRLPVYYPSNISEQKAIAGILSSLDDKIELNRKMNETLEKMAQAIFKHWFIDFEFPDQEGKPYKSSGGEMVDSELGEIPKGWRIGEIGEMAKILGGYAFKSGDFKLIGQVGIIKIRNISGNLVDISNTQFVDKDVVVNLGSDYKLNPSDLLIAMTGAEVGKVGLIPNNDKELYLNQRVGKFLYKDKIYSTFIYFQLVRDDYQSLLNSTASGSAQPNISAVGIERLPLIIAPKELLLKYYKLTQPIIENICASAYENETLTDIRDSLLPKLMSGKIRVPV